jgi:hypothetical protein
VGGWVSGWVEAPCALLPLAHGNVLHQQPAPAPFAVVQRHANAHVKSVESTSRWKECALQPLTRRGARLFSSVMPTISLNVTSSPAGRQHREERGG